MSVGGKTAGEGALSSCRKKLIDLHYTNPESVLTQGINLMSYYERLELKSAVIERKGNSDELIKFDGEIPISQNGNHLNITGFITIWIEKNFPLSAPTIKLNKTNFPSIYFEPFLAINQSTVIYSPYFEWQETKSTLIDLIQSVCANLRQVCLGWVLSARDQEDPNWAIPPRLSMPDGFQPFPMQNNPNSNPIDTSPIGARPSYLNAGQMGPNMVPQPLPPMPPNQPLPPMPPNQSIPPFRPMPPFQQQFSNPPPPMYPMIRQTAGYVSVVGPNQYPRPMSNNQYPQAPPSHLFSPLKTHTPVAPVQQPVEEPLNGLLISPPLPLAPSAPSVPASARKMTTKNL